MGSRKNPSFREGGWVGGGGVRGKPIYWGGGGLPKGGLGQLADLRGAWQERGTLCLNK